jgi:autoinducer 2-degrading protein
MYHIAACFDVPPEHHEAFIDSAFEDGRNSGLNERGTRRFELIRDEDNPSRFYLYEVYDDRAAFDRHRSGPYFKKFFEIIGVFAKDPTRIICGTQIDDAHSR